MISLTSAGVTLTLHPDLYWSDEHNWHPVEQTAQRTITGAQIISTAARIGGRPLTLEPFDESSAWLPRATVETLRQWAATPGKEMTLTLRGVAYAVLFRHQDAPALDAKPIIHFNDADAADWYSATLKFMEI